MISCELDSHAATCCFGSTALLLSSDLSNCASVAPFMSKLGVVKNVPIASIAVAYDCPDTYITSILVFHQVLYIEDMSHALINPNQLRHNGIMVNDCPLNYIAPNERTTNSHAIITNELKMPLTCNGVISTFNVRRPTISEMNDINRFTRINMTTDATWDPSADFFSDIEESL
jgi:hypothetical protein